MIFTILTIEHRRENNEAGFGLVRIRSRGFLQSFIVVVRFNYGGPKPRENLTNKGFVSLWPRTACDLCLVVIDQRKRL